MKKIIVIVTLLLLITGCKKETKEENRLEKVLKEKNYIVLDVRTKEEYETSHVKDSLNIPYDEIDENTNLDKNKTILVYCRSGKRSHIAMKPLQT